MEVHGAVIPGSEQHVQKGVRNLVREGNNYMRCCGQIGRTYLRCMSFVLFQWEAIKLGGAFNGGDLIDILSSVYKINCRRTQMDILRKMGISWAVTVIHLTIDGGLSLGSSCRLHR